MKITVLRLKGNVSEMFRDAYKDLIMKGLKPIMCMYEEVWTDKADYHGDVHAFLMEYKEEKGLAISDVVELVIGNMKISYFIDHVGFKPLRR